MRLYETEHGEREGGFAGAGFADHPERLARREVEIDVVHRGEAPALEPAADSRQRRRVVHVDVAGLDDDAAPRRLNGTLGAALDELLRIGVLRTLDHVARPALLDHHALFHHRDSIGKTPHQVQVMRDEEERHAALRAQVLQKLQDLQPDRDIQRGGRLIGDQQLRAARERHRDHRALALPARELVRIALRAALGVLDADPLERRHRLRPRLVAAQRRVQLERFDDLVADREDRVQRRHRLLEDHRDVAPAHVLQLVAAASSAPRDRRTGCCR